MSREGRVLKFVFQSTEQSGLSARFRLRIKLFGHFVKEFVERRKVAEQIGPDEARVKTIHTDCAVRPQLFGQFPGEQYQS